MSNEHRCPCCMYAMWRVSLPGVSKMVVALRVRRDLRAAESAGGPKFMFGQYPPPRIGPRVGRWGWAEDVVRCEWHSRLSAG